MLDNRGLAVRDIVYHRHPETPDTTDERITRHQFDARGLPSQSADPRLYAAGRENFSYLPDLNGTPLRTQSADAGTTVALNDASGRAFLQVSNIGSENDRTAAVTRTFQYEEANLPGRLLGITGQGKITERFIWSGNSVDEQSHNLAGQLVSHYLAKQRFLRHRNKQLRLPLRERKPRKLPQCGEKRVIYLSGLELRSSAKTLKVITVGVAGRAQVRVLHWESGLYTGFANNQIRYSYDNLTGSGSLEMGASGELISQEEYYPFGGTALFAARSQLEVDYKTIRYSGKEQDETGLYYYGYRYYQPWTGRWLSADPTGTVDGLNLFRIVQNNPVTMHDPDGMAPANA